MTLTHLVILMSLVKPTEHTPNMCDCQTQSYAALFGARCISKSTFEGRRESSPLQGLVLCSVAPSQLHSQRCSLSGKAHHRSLISGMLLWGIALCSQHNNTIIILLLKSGPRYPLISQRILFVLGQCSIIYRLTSLSIAKSSSALHTTDGNYHIRRILLIHRRGQRPSSNSLTF